MARSFRLWSFAVGFSAVLAVSGCNCGNTQPGSPCSPGQTESCSCPGSAIGTQLCGPDGGLGVCQCSTSDSGTPADAGGGGHDSGTVNQDSGTPNDAGTGGQDSGVNNDAGSGQDSGTGGQDSGTGGNDSGTPADSGTGGQDSGTPADSGTGGQDSGTTSDAGTSDAGICGDGIINKGEQCDDGNQFNLDGCDKQCRYEMVTRMTSLQISGTTAPQFCTPQTNAFGTKVIASNLVLGQLNMPLQTDINNGAINILTQFLYLNDLTGTSNQSSGLTLGVYQGTVDPAKGAFATPNPIDWWFLASPATVNNGVSTDLFGNGTLASQGLSFSSNDLSLTISLVGVNATLEMLKANLVETIATSPAPNVPAPPPNALAAGITVFQNIGGSAAAQGLCGNVTVESLAAIPLPSILATGGQFACLNCPALGTSHTYTYCGAGNPVGPNCNSLLDAVVGGCDVVLCGGHVVNPTQPDVPINGTATPLSVQGPFNKVPSTTTNGDKDAYSSFFTLDQNRAHLTGETCAATPDCQTGQTCQAGVCK